MDDLGSHFWLKFAGVCIVGAIILLLFTVLLLKAAYAWGIFGALVAVAVIALALGWMHDRRERRLRAGL
jgi:Mn2+/Fe2+ NRAMP family transporter